jgi:ribose-phosphate pyrophosphokinase
MPELVLFSGNAHQALAEQMCEHLGVSLGKAFVTKFSDGETRVELQTNIRGRDVFVIQPTSAPVNHHLMEALIIVDACRRASAQTITLVTPYFGYARQERKSAPRTPITAKLVAELMEGAGVTRLLTLELHNAAIQGFFNIPVDHLFVKPVFANYFNKLHDGVVVVSPDAGGVERARAMAKHLQCSLAIVDKRRDGPNECEVSNIIGDVRGKLCLIIDDIIDTGGSLIKATDALLASGAREVHAAITHPVLSGRAVANIKESALVQLVVTDSIPLGEEAKKCSKIKQITISNLMAEAILRIHNFDSVSSLFI